MMFKKQHIDIEFLNPKGNYNLSVLKPKLLNPHIATIQIKFQSYSAFQINIRSAEKHTD